MLFSIIVAMAKNRAIGKDNTLPWHLPADLKYFKVVTMNKPILMGRKTYESIGRPLPGRHNIVLTRDPQWSANGVTVVNSLSQAATAAKNAKEIMIIGGAQIYDATLNTAQRLYITEVDCHVDGDAFFPDIDPKQWNEVSRDRHPAEDGKPGYCFVVYDRL